MLQTDKGTEYLNAMFQHMLMDNDIHWYNTKKRRHQVGSRRAFQLCYFTSGPRYTDVLQKLIDSYNVTYHRSIAMPLNEVNANNENLLPKWLYTETSVSR